MSDKKQIDRLFQEKLKDFQATPSDAVWQNINSKLQHQERDKKVIPLWIKITGIAAGLLLLVAVGSVLINSNDNPSSETIVDTKPDDSTNEVKSDNNGFDLNSVEDENIASENTVENKQDDSNTSANSEDKENVVLKNNINNNSNAITNQQKSNLSQDKLISNKKDAVENTNNTVVDKTNKTPDLRLNKNLNQLDEEKANALIKNETSDVKSAVVENNSTEETKDETNSLVEENKKASLTDEVLNQEDALTDEDEKEKLDRWSVAPVLAPVYFNSLGNGSSIDPQFNNNSRSGDLNLSYGIAANYKVSDKLSIRAGVNQVNLGYNTDNIVIYNNVQPLADNPLKHVRLNEYGQSLSFLSADGLDFAQVPGVVSDNIKSSISQKFGFIEVPVELKYKLSDKKVGVSIIGGFSSLFLNKNEVYTSLQGEETLLGEATNIKKTSFSANLGLGFDFKISEQFNLNLEPVVKYQLNTFSDTSGDFNPYFIGIYTGFSFKF